jgi:serine/threonine protein phosphatase PrpC
VSASSKARAVRLSWADCTETGTRDSNQDRIGAARDGELACFVVADGAGGHAGGETAARLVRDEVLAAFLAHPGADSAAALRYLDTAIARVAAVKAADPSLADMSSTAAALLIDQAGASAAWAHLGDSRIYLFRTGAVLHASRDHSLTQQLVDGGYLDAGAQRNHPQRHMLLAAVGIENGIRPSACEGAVDGSIALLPGDALLVCSDGLWEWVDEAGMLAALHASARAEDWLAALCSHATAACAASPGAARDNFSAYAIRVHGGEPSA